MSTENEIEVDNTDENSLERNETENVNVITEKPVDATLNNAVNDESTPSTSSQSVENTMSTENEIEVDNTDENSIERNETENVNAITEKPVDVTLDINAVNDEITPSTSSQGKEEHWRGKECEGLGACTRKTFGLKPLSCAQPGCLLYCHKQEKCSGLTKTEVKHGSIWRCPNHSIKCLNKMSTENEIEVDNADEKSPERNETGNVNVITEKPVDVTLDNAVNDEITPSTSSQGKEEDWRGKECEGLGECTRKTFLQKPLSCAQPGCLLYCHKQKKCSGFTITEVERGSMWRCPNHSIKCLNKIKCGKIVKQTHKHKDRLTCNICKGQCHKDCVELPQSLYNDLHANEAWICDDCLKKPLQESVQNSMSTENEIEVDNTDENSLERNEKENVNVITEKPDDVALDNPVNDEITPSTSSQIVENSMSTENEIEVDNTDENSLERNETENVNVITEKPDDVALNNPVNDEITPSTSSQIVQNSMSTHNEIEVDNTDENSPERNETENVNVITTLIAPWAIVSHKHFGPLFLPLSIAYCKFRNLTTCHKKNINNQMKFLK